MMSRAYPVKYSTCLAATTSKGIWTAMAIGLLGVSALAWAADTAPPAVARSQEPPPFDVMEYDVEGNTLLKPIDIERAVTPFLGEKKTIKDVEAARARLEQVYHDRGYKT